MSGSDAQLFEENFVITRLSDPKYDRVDRIYASSEPDKSIDISLDINKELFPCKIGDELTVALATSLSLDGSKDDERGWRDVAKAGSSDATLADDFDYVCYGKVYKFEDAEDGQTIKAYVSFGGLLMSLAGSYKKLTPLRVDNVYLLVRKRR
ncbi:DNA-directed RNA polymerases I, II, and III subunit RPABC3 [Cladorrhinum samala]|uniref:DNA-directed RNA polymerases I, II, and III subunit RPABC3 n=1 Tax=Cladorrhinum samala TaxID=585594 RepID=A0AAV9HSI3_9PEZI|nr:DNA-directed RNA polymerases I, II, and III subunit RPABC3 [Cladorrhinum samala]